MFTAQSLLFVPGHRPDRFGKAAAAGAGLTVIDLEDAVPAADKPAARAAALAQLGEDETALLGWGLRINAVTTAAGIADLAGLGEAAVLPPVLLLPMVESPVELKIIANALGARCPGLVPLIETPAGLRAAHQIGQAPGVVALMFGGGDFSAIHAMLSDPNAMMGLSDGGAHVGFSSDGSFPTYLLSHWARDRTRGPKLSLERAVALQTGIPARHFGLDERGQVAVGRRADLNVIDFTALGLEKPEIHADLPAGGIRFLQGARGYIETLLAGETVSAGGVLTGARPGKLVRKTRG
jgi:hypothetical protein